MPTQVTLGDLAAIQICPCCKPEFAYVAMIESENGQQIWCVVIPEYTPSHGYYYIARWQPNTNMITITGQTIICESAEHSNEIYNEQIETSKFLDIIKLQYL